MSEVLQCPYCDLKFSTRGDLDQHKAFDHPGADEEAATPEEVPAEGRGPADEQTQTAGGQEPEKKKGFFSRLFGG